VSHSVKASRSTVAPKFSHSLELEAFPPVVDPFTIPAYPGPSSGFGSVITPSTLTVPAPVSPRPKGRTQPLPALYSTVMAFPIATIWNVTKLPPAMFWFAGVWATSVAVPPL
jgi:hypothetical protein